MGKSDRVKSRTKRSKRRFYGNQNTRKEAAEQQQQQSDQSQEQVDQVENKNQGELSPVNIPKNNTASSSKIQSIPTDTPKQTDPTITGYRFVDVGILTDIITMLCCPECKKCSLNLHENFTKKKGFASLLFVKCLQCDFEREFYTSQSVDQKCDINQRIIYAMRSIGQGYSSLGKFTTLMDMPSPMTVKNYDRAVQHITEAVVNVAEETMSEAVQELKTLKGKPDDEIVDASITCDGTWQRRGFASLNGSFTSISLDTGKIIDTEVMSRYCKGCKSKENLKKNDELAYATWFENHNCKLNHVGSAGSMEVNGAKRIFSRSIEKHGLRYTQYLGDGDSKSFSSVKNIYSNAEVEKLECVGHIQKRVGNRLRNLKKNVKDLGGRGNLTNKTIDRLQNYYGIAIRSNVGNLEGMKKGVLAALFHVASSKRDNYHTAYCPPGENSWCKFQRDKSLGTSMYKPGPGLPQAVIKHVKPIFNELSQESLLRKCLHGKTQNQNECYNGLIWGRLPKTTYVSLTQLRFGSYDAVAHFNIGQKSSLLIYEKLKMIPGRYMTKQCSNINRKRLFHSNYKSSEKARKRRKILRGAVKSGMDINEQTEGNIYEAGGF